jgi:hypothetical protein
MPDDIRLVNNLVGVLNDEIYDLEHKFDSVSKTLPNVLIDFQGAGTVVAPRELKENDFDETQKELLIPSQVGPQFKVDISGTEFIFLKHALLNDETSTT